METLGQAKTSPIYLDSEDIPAFAYKGLTVKQSLSVQMRHYVLSMNGQFPESEVGAQVTQYRNNNVKRFGGFLCL